MNVASFVAGYRLGHDGLAPAIHEATVEHELSDIESDNPGDTHEHDWAWHLIGWSVGQAVAAHKWASP